MSQRSLKNPFVRAARVFGIGAFCFFVATSIASGQFKASSTIEPLDPASLRKLKKQRELVTTLARRHVGSTLSGDPSNDLRILQRLYDRVPRRDRRLAPFGERAVTDNERIFEIQALGVALGDLMALNFDLEWVMFEDQRGRGRALNVKGTRDLVFPVSMISRLYEVSLPVDLRAIYDETAATLALRPEKPNRPKLPPKPSLPEE